MFALYYLKNRETKQEIQLKNGIVLKVSMRKWKLFEETYMYNKVMSIHYVDCPNVHHAPDATAPCFAHSIKT
jgi:hypothetical protein